MNSSRMPRALGRVNELREEDNIREEQIRESMKSLIKPARRAQRFVFKFNLEKVCSQHSVIKFC